MKYPGANRGGTGGLLHRNKEYLALFGLYAACTPPQPPPKPHAYTQLKKGGKLQKEQGERSGDITRS